MERILLQAINCPKDPLEPDVQAIIDTIKREFQLECAVFRHSYPCNSILRFLNKHHLFLIRLTLLIKLGQIASLLY